MTDAERFFELGLHAGADFTMPGAQAHYPPDLELEPVHLDIDLQVDVPGRTAHGTVTTHVKAARGGPSAIKLNAVDFLELQARDADGRKLGFSYDGEHLTATWDEPFQAGEERKLAVTYKVKRPVNGLHFSGPDDAYPDAPEWAATDHETERARHWLPCIDHPNVRPTLAFHLRADKRYTILANGELVKEEKHDDGTKTAHWRLEQGCPSYITCFAIGDFVRCDDGEHNGKPIAYFASKEWTAEDLKRTFGRTGAMLDWMTKKLDSEYPYPKYFQFALLGIGGAMENISLVSWEDMLVLDETLAKEWTWLLDQINLHEMAHAWFGDWIVCRDFAHAWLKESWAVYTETLWLEDSKGADERDYDFYANLNAYLAEADQQYMRPIATRTFDHSWNMYDRHLYPGGAVRLHMLRHELGDETFFAAVRDYVATYGGKTVETDDFRKVMEKHSGKSLVKWFEQWFESKGYPDLKVSFSHDSKKQEGTFEVQQTQKHKDAPVFEFTTDIGWSIDGQDFTKEVKISRRKHAFTVPMASEPQQVRFDPGNHTVCKFDFNPGAEKLKAQLGAADVGGRVHAAHELCKTGKRANIDAVRDAFKSEPFWGVRVQMAEALGKAGVQPAVEALAELLGVEQDGMVCETLVRNAGGYRDALVRDALQKFLDKGPRLHRARGAAWEALGNQRAHAPVEKLLEAAKQPGLHGFELGGIYRGLAASRHESGAAFLREAVGYGNASRRARTSAAMAFGAAAKVLDKHAREQAVETLSDLLRDPDPRMQKAALQGLAAAGGVEAAGKVEAWSRGLSEQERTGVRKVLHGIRAAAKPKAEAKDKELEELRDKLRKTEDRLEKLEQSKQENA
jgi:aminopeptidase N